MSSTNSTRSVYDIIADIDDAISQDDSSSQFSIEFLDDDYDDDDDDDDDSSFEEEVLEEEDAAMANVAKATSSGSYMKGCTNKHYDPNHHYDLVQDEIKEDFNPLSILEKGSQQRKKMVDVPSTKKELNVLDTLQRSKRLNAAETSRSQDFHQRSQMKSTSSIGRTLSHLPEDEEMSFEESMCSESTADDFSMSLCSVSTSVSNGLSASENIKLPPEHLMETPRVNNRKGVFDSKQQHIVEGEAPTRSRILGLISSNQEAGGSNILPSSSIKRYVAKLEPQATQGTTEEVSISSNGTSNDSMKKSIASSISYIGSILLGGSDSSSSIPIKDRSTSGSRTLTSQQKEIPVQRNAAFISFRSTSRSTNNEEQSVAMSTSSSIVGGKGDLPKIGHVNSLSKSTHTFSVIPATPTKATSVYQPPILTDCEDDDDRVWLKKSIMSRKSTPPKSKSPFTVKRARQLLVDIESGSQYLDQRSGEKNNKAWSKKRKCVLIAITIIILVICVIAVLAVLHMISVVSLDGILPGQTANVEDIHNPETTNNIKVNQQPPQAPTDESDISGIPWYADLNANRCVQDAGTLKSDHEPFNSLKECCYVNFASFISEDWSMDECIIADATVLPTYQTTPLQHAPVTALLYYADWDTSKCTKEDSNTKKPWDMGYETEDECCVANFSWDENIDCKSGENDAASNSSDSGFVLSTPSPTALTDPPAKMLVNYYADFVSGKCVQGESTQTNGKYQESYETEEECCRINFGWDANGICYMDGMSTAAPTVLTDPPASIVVEYYADWVAGECVQDDSTQTNGIYQDSYETEEECCQINFGWDVNGICYEDGVSTSAPSIINRDRSYEESESTVPSIEMSGMPSGSVPDIPTYQPTTQNPTSSSPTSDPTLFPSASPTNIPTASPIRPPTLVPTAVMTNSPVTNRPVKKPTQNPTPSSPTSDPTSHPSTPPTKIPTSSPTNPPTLVPTAVMSESPVTSQPVNNPTQNPTTSPASLAEKPTTEETQICPEKLDAMTEIDSSASFFFAIVPSHPSGSGNGLLCGRLEVESDGWIGLAISEDGKMSGSQAIIGIVGKKTVMKYDLFNNGAVEMSGGNQTLRKTSIYEEDGKITMKFTKLLVEDGEIPILEDEVNSFLYARGDGNKLRYHSERSSFKIDFGPFMATQASPSLAIFETYTPRNEPFTQSPTKTPSSSPTSSRPSKSPTKKPSDMPTYYPTSESPTDKPVTKFPTKTPSSSPISSRPSKSPTKEPSDMPTGLPTSSPTPKPSMSPTAISRKPSSTFPTKRPTHRPSLPPILTPTGRPTSSPTGQLEILRTHLTSLSPASVDSLDDTKSDQYRAMEWLLENTGYITFSSKRKVQRWVLVIFYRSLNGDEWTIKDGWTQDPTYECTWHGVVCDANGLVTSINLSENNLRGELPMEVALLVNIKSLVLHTNSIWGLPSSVFGILSLQVLDLDENYIWEIPSEVIYPSGGTQLTELYLSNNKIEFIPDGLFQLQNVTHLWLRDNKISSPLPSGLGMMKKLVELDLERNFFTGTIPDEIYSLVNLQALFLYDNILTGTLSPSLSQMKSLKILDLHTNYISGVIPTQIGLLSQLTELHLGDNEFVGQLPWGQLSLLGGSLLVLDASLNYLNSTIGAEIGSLPKLVTLRLDNNYRLDDDGILISYGIRGSMPGSIGDLKQLEELRLDNNYVGGTLPASLGNLQKLVSLRLESNNLQSSIPSTLGNLASLQYLHLWSNYLSSTISGQLGRLKQLQELFLDDNDLTGTIPPELGQLVNATYIALAENELTGVIPPAFGMLSNLQRLDLQFNNLVGQVPQQLSNLPLGKVKLEGNSFYGNIPDGVCQMVQYLSGNCAVTLVPTRRPSSLPASRQTSTQGGWSCNCCTTCYSG